MSIEISEYEPEVILREKQSEIETKNDSEGNYYS